MTSADLLLIAKKTDLSVRWDAAIGFTQWGPTVRVSEKAGAEPSRVRNTRQCRDGEITILPHRIRKQMIESNPVVIVSMLPFAHHNNC